MVKEKDALNAYGWDNSVPGILFHEEKNVKITKIDEINYIKQECIIRLTEKIEKESMENSSRANSKTFFILLVIAFIILLIIKLKIFHFIY